MNNNCWGGGDIGAKDAGYGAEWLPLYMFSEGVAALLLGCWLDEALKNTQLFEMGQKPFSISLPTLCCVPLMNIPAKSAFWVGGEKPGIIIIIICLVSELLLLLLQPGSSRKYSISWTGIQALETMVMFSIKVVATVEKVPRCFT